MTALPVVGGLGGVAPAAQLLRHLLDVMPDIEPDGGENDPVGAKTATQQPDDMTHVGERRGRAGLHRRRVFDLSTRLESQTAAVGEGVVEGVRRSADPRQDFPGFEGEAIDHLHNTEPVRPGQTQSFARFARRADHDGEELGFEADAHLIAGAPWVWGTRTDPRVGGPRRQTRRHLGSWSALEKILPQS